MIKPLLLLLGMFFIPITISAQGVRITEEKVEKLLINMENAEVDIIELKTMPKWKALDLSQEMKSRMDYNIVRVKYISNGTNKTVIIDSNLVPIRYDYLDLLE
jgi:ATP:corrinoid adenosyltransferase